MTLPADPVDRELASIAPAAPELEAKIRAAIGEVRPVRRLAPPIARAAIVVAIALAIVGFLADPIAGQPDRIAGALVLALLGSGGAWLAMRLAVPGSGVPGVVAVLWIALPAFFAIEAFVSLGASGGVHGSHCLVVGSAAAAMPFAAGAAMVARGWPVQPAVTGAVAGIAAGTLATVLLTLDCPVSEGPHVALFHGGVLVVCGVAGALAGVVTARLR